ncbi:MAG: flagellar hook-associated protein FlgL [Sandaracinaceae bacterium]
MRVTDSMFNELNQRGLTARREDVFETTRIASSGLRVEKPSDDPVAASGARAAQGRQKRAETASRVSSDAIDRLNHVDGVLDGVGSSISRARELAVLGANDHLNADDRHDLATEVAELRKQVLAMANTQVEGEHVFGGLAVDRAPFDAAGAYQGDAALRELELGPGVRIPTQVSGQEAFAAPGGVNVFDVLDRLEAALQANDGAGVHDLLGDLDTASSQIAHARSAGGAAQQSLMQARAAAERTMDEAQQRRSALTEADPVSAFTDLIRAQEALRTALSIAQQLPPASMVGA